MSDSRSLTSASDLKRFTLECLRRSGAIVEEKGYELLEALLTEEMSRRISQEHLIITFDAEVYRETPEATFVTYGSPVFEAVIEQAKTYGELTQLYWPGTTIQAPQNLAKKIQESIEFLRCRPPSVEMHWVAEHCFYCFFYICTFQSFEKTEEILPVVIDGYTGEVREDFFHWWDAVMPTESPEYNFSPAIAISPEEAYERSCSAAEMKAKKRAQAIYDCSAVYRRRELNKIVHYYVETEGVLQGKLQVADTEEKKARLTAQIAATQADRQRRLMDAQERYRVLVDVRLDHVMTVSVPHIHTRLKLQSGKTILQPVVLYNPLNGKVEPLFCAACRRRVNQLTLDKEGRLVCGQGCKAR